VACPVSLGAVKPTFPEPSLVSAVPRRTARMGSPSWRAARSGFTTTRPPSLVDMAPLLGKADADPAGQGDVALAFEERPAGEVDGDERGRAGGLHGERGAAEVELVGHPGGEEVLV